MSGLLIDSCVLIDISRGNTDALDYLETLDDGIGISVLSLVEVLRGVKNKKEEQYLQELFASINQYDITPQVALKATEYLNQYQKSHNIGAMDAMIAATAEVEGLELVTMNLKHFPMFADLQRPY